MTNLLIAHGVHDAIAALAGDKLNLRARVFFAYGFHGADDAKRYQKEAGLALQAAYVAAGKRPETAASTASAMLKDAVALGKVFGAKFAPELVSAYASEAHRVQACYMAMGASGVDSVKSFQDWVNHGDAAYSIKEKARKDAEKAAEAAALAEAIQKAAEAAGDAASLVEPLGIDSLPELQAPAEAAAPVSRWDAMSDAAIAELIAEAQAVLAARAEALAEAVAA